MKTHLTQSSNFHICCPVHYICTTYNIYICLAGDQSFLDLNYKAIQLCIVNYI